jgi:hypothetical protein
MAGDPERRLGWHAFDGRGEALVDVTMVFGVLSGVGLLALSIGAFGVLDAYHKRNQHAQRVDWLIALYAGGVLMNVAAYTIYGRWYVAAPLLLMLLPADRAMRIRAAHRRRRAELDTFNGTGAE